MTKRLVATLVLLAFGLALVPSGAVVLAADFVQPSTLRVWPSQNTDVFLAECPTRHPGCQRITFNEWVRVKQIPHRYREWDATQERVALMDQAGRDLVDQLQLGAQHRGLLIEGELVLSGLRSGIARLGRDHPVSSAKLQARIDALNTKLDDYVAELP